MKKELSNITWYPSWVSHLGCIKSCVDYLGLEISYPWLFGATGHAFLLNIHKVVCPSGPTAWISEKLLELGKNIGYTSDVVFAVKNDSDFKEKQKFAWNHIRAGIDGGFPCYGWELQAPEFYLITGYDTKGYYFTGPMTPQVLGPKPWDELGETDIGLLEMYVIKPNPKADDVKIIKSALDFAIEFSESPSKWILPDYKAGLAGYDYWIEAIKQGKTSNFGMGYNAVIWQECRSFATQFLREANERLNYQFVQLFDAAVECYEIIAQSLQEVADRFPFPPDGNYIADENSCEAAIRSLETARLAEELGLEVLKQIVLDLEEKKPEQKSRAGNRNGQKQEMK